MSGVEFNGVKYWRRSQDGYWVHTHKLGPQYLHRAVWSATHGPLQEGWDVHHKDFDRSNNELSNLQAMPAGEHDLLHGANRTVKGPRRKPRGYYFVDWDGLGMDLNKSPFTALREATGLTKAEFVREAAISRTTGVYLEAGLFLVPRAVDKLAEIFALREIDMTAILEDEYDATLLSQATILWQKKVRQSHTYRIQEAFAAWADDDFTLEVDPFTQFVGRAFDNMDQFCKAMKVQTGPVKLWLETSRSMPEIVSTTLLDAGLDPLEIGTIASEVDEWRAKTFPTDG